jgi:hypothetical protein
MFFSSEVLLTVLTNSRKIKIQSLLAQWPLKRPRICLENPEKGVRFGRIRIQEVMKKGNDKK